MNIISVWPSWSWPWLVVPVTVGVLVLVVADVARDRWFWRAQMDARREWERTGHPVPGWPRTWQVGNPHPSLLSALGISEDDWWSLVARQGRRGVVAAVVTAVVSGPSRPASAPVAVVAPSPVRAVAVRALSAGVDVEGSPVSQGTKVPSCQGTKDSMSQDSKEPRIQDSKVPEGVSVQVGPVGGAR